VKKGLPLLLLLSALLVFSAGCGRPMAAPSGSVTASISGKPFTAGDMRAAIIKGCAARNWRVTDAGPDTMEATISMRNKHTVVVSIPYTATSYTINYKDSTNMGYKAKDDGTFSINKNYNKLVLDLEQAIQSQIALKQTTM
jgi:hypothetical protein